MRLLISVPLTFLYVLLFELTLCSCNEGVMVIILSNTLWFVDEFCQNEWIKDKA